MKKLGFKKTKEGFVTNEEESVLKLSFGHATQGEKHVRYYSCIYSVDFPKIQEAAQSMGEHVYGHYGQIGYIMPEKRFIEWRLADSDTDEYYLMMINEIYEALTKYVIPFMENYSTIEAFVDGVESGNIKETFSQKAVAIAYVLLGRKESALQYIDRCIEKEKHLDIIGKGIVIKETKEYRMVTSFPQENNYLKGLISFAQKLKAWMN